MSLIEIPDPAGYRVVAYRKPLNGERFLVTDGSVETALADYQRSNYPIIEPVEAWRPATFADLARVPCRARFRQAATAQWTVGRLNGWRDGKWLSKGWADMHVFCEVLEAPEGAE